MTLAVAGCSNPFGTALPPVEKTILIPPTSESLQADAGMILVANGTYFAYEGIRLRNTINARLGVGGNPAQGLGGSPPNVMLRPQYLFPQSQDDEYIYYTGNVRFYYGGAPVIESPRTAASQWKVGGLRISKTDSKDIAIWAPRQDRVYDPEFPAKNFRIGRPVQTPMVQAAIIERSLEDAWAKELVYVGLADNGALHFIYREHRGDAKSPVDQTEIEFNPTDQSVLTVHGAKLEIEGIHDEKIFFRVLENFRPPPEYAEAVKLTE